MQNWSRARAFRACASEQESTAQAANSNHNGFFA